VAKLIELEASDLLLRGILFLVLVVLLAVV
jgi:hypothetical protein